MSRHGWRPPASCRPCRWSPDVMAGPALPIMLFDERKLTPSFGYVFNPKWLGPYESIVSILWKLVRMNSLSGHMVAIQLAKAHIDPYERIAACRSEVNIRGLHRALGLPLKILRGSLAPDALQKICSPHFRYCRKCLGRGYHGVIHQLNSVKCCPVHGETLSVECDHCGARTPYRLNALLLDAPFRCSSCRNFYASHAPAISTRPLGKRARRALTRMRLTYTLYF